MLDINLTPIISEKSMSEANKGKFTFRVDKKADKEGIRKLVAEKFKVDVVSIATSIVKGKSRRFGTKRTETALSSWKKATVKLKEGQKISMFDKAGTDETPALPSGK